MVATGSSVILRSMCRHLRGRQVPQSSRKQDVVGPQSTQRVDELTNGALHAATSLSNLQSTEAGPEMQQSAASMQSDAANSNTELSRNPAADQNIDEACNGRQVSDQHTSALRSAQTGSAAKHRRHVKYFQEKQVPCVTGWWEVTCAFMAVFLLPLIAVVPFSTTAERPDSHFGQL